MDKALDSHTDETDTKCKVTLEHGGDGGHGRNG